VFVRVSHMVPKAGQEARVNEVLNKLSAFYRDQPGYQGGWVLQPYEGAPANARRFGRVGTWADVASAEHAAQLEHAMALRAELSRIVDEDSHLEYTFEGESDAK